MNKFKPLSLQSLGIIFGALTLVVFLIVFGLMQLEISRLPKPPVPHSPYATSVLSKEMKSGGIFDLVKELHPVQLSEPAAIQYRSEDLGKQDLSQYD